MCVVVEPEVIIVNLLKNDKRKYIEMEDIYDFCLYLKSELEKVEDQINEPIYFGISFDAIERTLIYNNKIYDLINDRIYFKEEASDKYLENVNLHSSEIVVKIIKNYLNKEVA